jgi:hypothetical protein
MDKNMPLNNSEEALRAVIAYCVKILNYEGRPSDESIDTCKDIMDIIREVQNKK